MIRVLKWAGLALAALMVLMVLAALLLPSLVNLERYRAALASRLGKALGRAVTLGSLRVNLWGGIGAEARGIQIAEAPGFGPEPFVTADGLRVRVQLLPLLRGQVKVSTVVLERPRIRLVHSRDGRWSVEDLMKSPPTPPSPKAPTEVPRPGQAPLWGGFFLTQVAVRDGQVTLLDQVRSPGLTLALTDVDLSLRQASVTDPLEVRSRARLGIAGAAAGRLEAAGRVALGEPENPTLDLALSLREAEAGPWQALLLGGGAVRLSGPLAGEVKVTGPLARAAFAAKLDLTPVAVQVGEVFRKAAGEEASLFVEGRREDGGVNLPRVTVTLKALKAEGSLRIPSLRAPQVAFTATAARVDLDRLLSRPAARTGRLAPAAAYAAAPGRPREEARAAAPALTVQGRVTVGELTYHGLAWTALQADLRYRDGVVWLPDVQANFVNGTVRATGEVDLRPKVPRIALTSKLENLATEPLVRALAPGSWTLKSGLSFEGSLRFAGLSGAAILGSASGEGSLRLRDGRLVGYRPLEKLAEVIGPILAAQGLRVRLDEFEQVSGHYTLEKGVLRTKDLTLTTVEGRVTAAGSLGLLDSSLNFDVVARLGRSTIEAKVTGTTSQPVVLPKLGRLQRKIETELDKALPGQPGQSLKDLFKGLFGK